jgi:hypothetical protein
MDETETRDPQDWSSYWAKLSWAEQNFLYELWGVLYNTHLRSQLRPI